MGRVFLFGCSLAVVAGFLIAGGALLGLAMGNVLVGVAAGAILALVREHTPVARIGAYVIGLVLTLVFYLLRLALLPQNWAGLAVSIFFLLLIFTVISGLTKGRLPLWAMILAAMVMSGGYESDFWATPWYAGTQLPTTFACGLVAAAGGFLIVLLVEWREKRGGVDSKDPMMPEAPPEPELPEAQPAGAATGSTPNAGMGVFGSSQGGK